MMRPHSPTTHTQTRIAPMTAQPHTVVLGLGNVLLRDEGFGLRVLEALYNYYDFDPPVELIDGGTQGLGLLHIVEDADRLLILDVVDFGKSQGTLITRENTDIPAYISAKKLCQHQNSFSEVLAMAALRERLPTEMSLIGVQADTVSEGLELTDTLKAQVNAARDKALARLATWGIHATVRTRTRQLLHL